MWWIEPVSEGSSEASTIQLRCQILSKRPPKLLVDALRHLRSLPCIASPKSIRDRSQAVHVTWTQPIAYGSVGVTPGQEPACADVPRSTSTSSPRGGFRDSFHGEHRGLNCIRVR